MIFCLAKKYIANVHCKLTSNMYLETFVSICESQPWQKIQHYHQI
jgi:hypothetical protein